MSQGLAGWGKGASGGNCPGGSEGSWVGAGAFACLGGQLAIWQLSPQKGYAVAQWLQAKALQPDHLGFTTCLSVPQFLL